MATGADEKMGCVFIPSRICCRMASQPPGNCAAMLPLPPERMYNDSYVASPSTTACAALA
jgi:hypothetical protein